MPNMLSSFLNTVRPNSLNSATARPNASNNPIATSDVKPRDFKPNREVASNLRRMASDAKSGGASYNMLSASNAKMQVYGFNYHSGKSKVAVIETPPKADANGKRTLDLTVQTMVSGHDQGRDPKSAERYAQNNNYAIRITFPDGKQVNLRNIPRNDPDATEYSTAHQLSIDLQDGKTVIEAWPEGSAGVGGYVEGRRFELFCNQDPGAALDDGKNQSYPE